MTKTVSTAEMLDAIKFEKHVRTCGAVLVVGPTGLINLIWPPKAVEKINLHTMADLADALRLVLRSVAR